MAKDNLKLARGGTLVHERGGVMSKSERGRVRMLEEGGVDRPLARARVVEVVPTAELVRVKSLAPTLASNNGSMNRRHTVLQHVWTRGKKIVAATHDRAHAFPLVRGHSHGDVKTVNEADAVGGVVVAAVVDLELGEGGGCGAPGAVALEAAAAVAAGAGEGGAGVGAAGAGPDAAGPVGVGDGDGLVGEGAEGEAAAGEDGVAGVGLDAGPHGVVAVVDEG